MTQARGGDLYERLVAFSGCGNDSGQSGVSLPRCSNVIRRAARYFKFVSSFGLADHTAESNVASSHRSRFRIGPRRSSVG